MSRKPNQSYVFQAKGENQNLKISEKNIHNSILIKLTEFLLESYFSIVILTKKTTLTLKYAKATKIVARTNFALAELLIKQPFIMLI